MNWYLIFAYAIGSSFLLSSILTAIVRSLALRWGALDHPGERKMQKEPVPLLGGVAIFATFNLIILANLLLLGPVRRFGFDWLQLNVLQFLGTGVRLKLLGLSLGGLIIFVLGVLDDLKTLRPEPKLVGQLLAAFVVVASGIRLDLFLPEVWRSELLVKLVSGGVTMFWIVMMTNSMNFLDNMDGLSAGVSVIAALSMFVCLMPRDTFVCALLAVFAGSVAGFLYHNLNPARIYMGDAGAMFCGYVLSTSAVLATFYSETVSTTRVAVVAPLLALSVPIFDTVSVVFIRWRKGESIMKGDKRHFSHRLVDAGMTPRQAVEFIFLVATITGLAAVLLRQVTLWGTVLIISQVLGIYCLIVLLMNAGNGRKDPRNP